MKSLTIITLIRIFLVFVTATGCSHYVQIVNPITVEPKDQNKINVIVPWNVTEDSLEKLSKDWTPRLDIRTHMGTTIKDSIKLAVQKVYPNASFEDDLTREKSNTLV